MCANSPNQESWQNRHNFILDFAAFSNECVFQINLIKWREQPRHLSSVGSFQNDIQYVDMIPFANYQWTQSAMDHWNDIHFGQKYKFWKLIHFDLVMVLVMIGDE